MSKTTKTPMLDKMIEVQEQSQFCGEFLEFLQKKYDMFDNMEDAEHYLGVGRWFYIIHIKQLI